MRGQLGTHDARRAAGLLGSVAFGALVLGLSACEPAQDAPSSSSSAPAAQVRVAAPEPRVIAEEAEGYRVELTLTPAVASLGAVADTLTQSAREQARAIRGARPGAPGDGVWTLTGGWDVAFSGGGLVQVIGEARESRPDGEVIISRSSRLVDSGSGAELPRTDLLEGAGDGEAATRALAAAAEIDWLRAWAREGAQGFLERAGGGGPEVAAQASLWDLVALGDADGDGRADALGVGLQTGGPVLTAPAGLLAAFAKPALGAALDPDALGPDFAIEVEGDLASYAVKASAPAIALAAPFVRERLGEAFADAADLITTAEMMRMDAPEFFHPYELERDVSVVFASDAVVSLRVDFYEFAGGAHPNHGMTGHLWDRRAQAPIAFADLFVDPAPNGPAMRAVQAAANAAWRAEVTERTGEAAPDEPTFGNLEADPDQFSSFVLVAGETPGRARAITFLYSPYEIGSYAEGGYELEAPASAFAAYLAPRYEGLFEEP